MPQIDMLLDAIAKARKLVSDLERQQAELEASPSLLPSEKLEEGRAAFDHAIVSARRMLAALEGAAAAAEVPTTSDAPDRIR